MKKIIQFIMLLSIVVLFFACNTDGRNVIQSATNSDMEILRHLKQIDWPKAYAKQDTILLDKILGDDFRMIDQSGNWFTKKDELDWIKKNAIKNDSFRYEIKRFEILDNGTAIICGTGHIQKDSIKSIYQSSNVLVKREGEWKAILSHVSGVRDIK